MNYLRLLGSLAIGLFLTFPISSLAQCPSGNITLANQAEVDLFVATYPACSAISGSLTIGDITDPIIASDINDLSGLSNLTTVNGNLSIQANPALANLNGLSGLNHVAASFYLKDNSLLNDISDLNNLSTIMGYAEIMQNDNISSISGLNNLTVGLVFTIGENENLTSISGLNNLIVNRALVLMDNNNLSTVSGLNNITVAISFSIMENPVLTDLSGFSYSGIPTPVIVTDNALLATCDAPGICDAVLEGLSNVFATNGTNCSVTIDVQNTCLGILPAELADFEATKYGRSILLSWKTYSERNNRGFQIQYSLNGQNWNDLDFIEGHGSTFEMNEYQYIHIQPEGARNFYRLKQLDFDGEISLSENKMVKLELENLRAFAEVFPNPSKGSFTIQMETTPGIKSLLKIVNATGSLVWEKSIPAKTDTELFIKNFDLPANQNHFLFIQKGLKTEVIQIQTLK